MTGLLLSVLPSLFIYFFNCTSLLSLCNRIRQMASLHHFPSLASQNTSGIITTAIKYGSMFNSPRNMLNHHPPQHCSAHFICEYMHAHTRRLSGLCILWNQATESTCNLNQFKFAPSQVILNYMVEFLFLFIYFFNPMYIAMRES